MRGITNLRELAERLEREGDLIRIAREADPALEIPAIARASDMGPVMLFDRVKGYPGVRMISNIFGSKKRIAKLCGVETAYLPRYLADAAASPIATVQSDRPACQEIVHRSDINLGDIVPAVQQTLRDAGHTITGGLALVRDPETGAFNGSYHRMRILGPDTCTITIQAGRHLLDVARKMRAAERTRIPITVNIGAGPAALLACSGSTQQTLTPAGYDELGLAGAIQGMPVEIARAVTQEDAWSIAEAELVLEGYIDTENMVSEDDEGEDGKKPFMPEAGGYMGRAWRVWEFKVTAITRRPDYLYWYPLAINMETTNLMAMTAEASVFETCRRISPKLFDTCNVLQGMRGCLGMVVRINRKSFRDEGLQNNLLFGALSAHSDMGWVIAVDNDIDIDNAEEVLWATITRTSLPDGLMITPRAKVSGMLAEGDAAGTGRKFAIDATAPFKFRDRYERGQFQTVDLADWLGADDVRRVRESQTDYVKSMLRRDL